MSDEMVRKVRDAIFSVPDGTPNLRDAVARAAIEAMRTMTPELRAVLEYQLDRQGHDQTLEATWNILIDAALSPPADGDAA